MTAEGKCPQCKVGSIVEEVVGSELNKICEECGCVIKDCALQQETFTFQEGYALSTSGTFERKYRVSVGDSQTVRRTKLCAEIVKQIQEYTKEFPNSDGLYEETTAMFMRVTESYIQRHRTTKFLIAAACVIIILRQNGHPVLTQQVCLKFGIPTKGMIAMLSTIKELEQTEYPSVLIENVVDGVLLQHIQPENREYLKKTTIHLCELFKELQLSASRPRKEVATCALYFAIISEGVSRKRPLKVTEFCRKYNVTCHNFMKTLSPIAFERLVVLANRLPWVGKPVTKTQVHLYIKDIIKSKLSLKSRDADPDNPPAEKRQRLSMAPNTGCSDIPKQLPETNAPVIITDQMKLELPPHCITLLKQNKEKVTADPDPVNVSRSETIHEEEFSDDISEYIRTPEEVALANKIKHMVGDEDARGVISK